MQVINPVNSPSSETFSIWVQARPLIKSADGDGFVPRLVQGLASDDSQDQEEENILQAGVDFSPLLEYGYINWDHRPGAANLIGTPLEAALKETRKGFGLWAKGELYQNKRTADEVWEHMLVTEDMRKAGRTVRELGWSVEGSILARAEYNPHIITKSTVRHLALTHQPVNAKTYAEIAKSLGRNWQHDPSFDAESNTHYSFSSFQEFSKSFGADNVVTTNAASPLNLQNLSPRVVSTLVDSLGKNCKGKCRREARGRRKSLAHLVECEGMAETSAFNLVKSLIEYLD